MNAYEIRLQLLTMAKDMLFQEWGMKERAASEEFYQKREIANRSDSIVPFPEIAPMPSANDILELAENLNKFLNRDTAKICSCSK
jgi:hypothetical protein